MTSMHTAWPDRAIAAVAARQDAAISHDQLCSLGVRPSLIAGALRRGRLHSVHLAVYSLVPEEARPRFAREHAALLASDPGAVLSHETAGVLQDLLDPRRWRDAPIHLTSTGPGRGRRQPGICVHRTAGLARGERVRVGRLAVTSVARTVLDLAPSLGDDALEQLVDRALRRTSRAKLRAAAERRRRRPGARRVLALLDPARPSAEAWSRTEARLRRRLVGAGLPAPEANQPIGPYVVDLLWREWRVIVEYDSELHDGVRARRRDAVRHNDLTSGGWQVLHVTWPQLRDHPDRVLVWVAVRLAESGWSIAA